MRKFVLRRRGAHAALGTSPVDPANYKSVNEGVSVAGGSLLANRLEAAGGFVCKRDRI